MPIEDRARTLPLTRWLTAIAPLVAIGLLPAQGSNPATQPPRLSGSRPNIIFIFSDDHAPHAISAYGSRVNETPNIDRLASGGMLFENNFCGNSICGPSRATILTGLHTHSHGFMRNGNRFDGSQTTFPKLLQQAGYATAMIGKWHLTSNPTGFDHWIVLPGQGQYYNPDFITAAGRKRVQGHATNLTTQFAIDWLESGRDADKPFVLMCQHKAPHRTWMPAPEELGLYRDKDIPEPATLFDDYQGRTAAARHQEMEIDRHMYMFYDLKLEPTAEQAKSLQGPDRWWKGMLERMNPEQRRTWDAAYRDENEAFANNPPTGKALVRWKYQRYIKNYLRCVAGVDRSVGELLDWLDAHPDIKDNTIVIYSSDQGFYLGDHGWYDKRWMYEESFKMPLVVSWPGKIKSATKTSMLTQNIDFAPTFLDLCGVPAPESMHGQSLVPVLEGRTETESVAWRDAVYYHYYESHAVHMVPAHYGARTVRHKLIRYYEPQWDAWELYDLETDPDEVNNVVDDPAYRDVVTRLKRRLVELREQYDDTTGTLGDGAFQHTAGIASAERNGDGWRIWANATGGYLLQDRDPQVPFSSQFKISTTMQPVAGRQQQNGYLILTAGNPRRQLVRVGVQFGNKKLHVLGPDGMKEQASKPIEWDGSCPIQVEVTADFAEDLLRITAAGVHLVADLPKDWTKLSAYGYGTSNAETLFGPLQVQ